MGTRDLGMSCVFYEFVDKCKWAVSGDCWQRRACVWRTVRRQNGALRTRGVTRVETKVLSLDNVLTWVICLNYLVTLPFICLQISCLHLSVFFQQFSWWLCLLYTTVTTQYTCVAGKGLSELDNDDFSSIFTSVWCWDIQLGQTFAGPFVCMSLSVCRISMHVWRVVHRVRLWSSDWQATFDGVHVRNPDPAADCAAGLGSYGITGTMYLSAAAALLAVVMCRLSTFITDALSSTVDSRPCLFTACLMFDVIANLIVE